MKQAAACAQTVPGGAGIFQRMFTRLGCLGRPPHFVVQFHPYADLSHTIRLREDVARVRLSDALRGAPRSVLEAAAAILLGRLYRRRPGAQILKTYREYSYDRSTRRKLLRLRRRRARRSDDWPAGAHHNLAALFARLNRKYFRDSLPRPRLGWSKRVWRTQLGSFDPALRQIVLNRQLDGRGVPEYVVGYVLYHEMLHLKHPMKFSRCRRESHSALFREQEKRFEHYAPAIRFLDRFPAP